MLMSKQIIQWKLYFACRKEEKYFKANSYYYYKSRDQFTNEKL